MDFSVEAANIRQFLLNFGSDPVVRIPEVVDEFSTSAILCMSYLEGVRIREAREAGFDMKRVGEHYLDVNYKMMLQHGFFHSDFVERARLSGVPEIHKNLMKIMKSRKH